MSIIHGILSLSGNIDSTTHMQHMAQSTQHFAPDGIGHSQQGPIALAANLLNTLPAQRYEPCPVVTETESHLSIVADARIDNRDELFQALEIEKQLCETISDVRLIFLAFQQWGEDCAARLIGDFAFAIWNSTDQTLFCCRDYIAQRPFYYYHSDDWFIFSSDLVALLCLPMVPSKLDDGYIADQIGGLHNYANTPPYQNIHCLVAAHWLTIKNKQFKTEKYWQPDLTQKIHFEQDEQYVERYLELFTEAVKCRLVSDDPVASFISGGLDASSISVVAANILQAQGQQLSSFCHVLPKAETNLAEDEKALVQLLEKKQGLTVNWVSYDKFDQEQLKPMIENPLSVSSPFMLTSLNQARNKGCKVMLAGFGGDQVATCHAYDLIYWLIHERKAADFLQQAKALADHRKISLLRAVISLIRSSNLFQPQITADKMIHKHLYDTCVFNHEFANQMDVMSLARSSCRFSGHHPRSFQDAIWKSLSEGKNPHNISAATFSRMQMEARHPMFDRRLVEFCLTVPPEQHRLGQGRRLIRRAMKGLLPDELRLRHDKTYSGCPGIQKDIVNQLSYYHKILTQAFKNPEIGRVMDLKRIQYRMNELSELIRQGKQKEFKLAATFRALDVAKLMLDHDSKWCERLRRYRQVNLS
jgi:asparagine synthase (glutamine-hydrolysing)